MGWMRDSRKDFLKEKKELPLNREQLKEIFSMLADLGYDFPPFTDSKTFDGPYKDVIKTFKREFSLTDVFDGGIYESTYNKIKEAYTIKKTKEGLTKLGYYHGEISGYGSEEFSNAVKNFKADLILKGEWNLKDGVSGKITNKLINILNEKIERLNNLKEYIPFNVSDFSRDSIIKEALDTNFATIDGTLYHNTGKVQKKKK